MALVARKGGAAGRGALRVAAVAVVVLAALAGAALLVPTLLGYDRYVITGSSMAGAYDRGSIVFARRVPVATLRTGDVITYTPPPGTGVRGQVTHRIVSVTRTRDGVRVFRTKGDANRAPDPWRFTLPHREQARAEFGVPLVGWVPATLSVRWLRMLVIGLPALVIALLTLVDLWRRSPEVTLPDRREAPA